MSTHFENDAWKMTLSEVLPKWLSFWHLRILYRFGQIKFVEVCTLYSLQAAKWMIYCPHRMSPCLLYIFGTNMIQHQYCCWLLCNDWFLIDKKSSHDFEFWVVGHAVYVQLYNIYCISLHIFVHVIVESKFKIALSGGFSCVYEVGRAIILSWRFLVHQTLTFMLILKCISSNLVGYITSNNYPT